MFIFQGILRKWRWIKRKGLIMQSWNKKKILCRAGGVIRYLWLMLMLMMPVAFAQEVREPLRRLSARIEGVYDANVSVIPFVGAKADYKNPLGLVPDVKAGEIAVIDIPQERLPGEFVLRIDYRVKETDHPYPAERIIFLNDQDMVMTVNPLQINNDEVTYFQEGEREDVVYAVFMKENTQKRMPIEALRQFLLSYDRPESQVCIEAEKEFEQRRREYNAWVKEQAKEHAGLFVSRLFQFHYIPAVDWSGDSKARVEDMLKHYFDGIDFSDPMILHSRELTRFLDQYMRLFGLQGQDRDEQHRLLIQAGETLKKKVEQGQGHPLVQAWIQEYLRKGYEAQGM